MKKYSTYYVWDITSDSKDHTIYAVEYKGKDGHISWKQSEMVVDRARRIAFKRTGNRKALRQDNGGFAPYSGSTGKVVKVPFSTIPLKKWIGKKRQPLAEFEFGDEYEYEDFLSVLDDRMNGKIYWKIDGRSIDWRNRSGHKVVKAETAKELLQAIYSEDILRLYCGKRKSCFELNAPTHDTPMGSFYYFTPISEKTYEANN